MRVMTPDVPATTSTSGLTARLLVVRPTKDGLIDAGFLLALILIASLGFKTSFDSWFFMVVVAVGALFGLVISHITTSLRWHWLVAVALAVLVYFLLGGAVALRRDIIAGFVPSIATFTDLAHMSVWGWKALLTTVPPVAGSGEFLVLPYLLALVFTTIGYAMVRLSRSPQLALVVPTLLFILVIILGTTQPAALLIQGVGFGVGALLWLVVRTNRRRSLQGTGNTRVSKIIIGGALVLSCAASSAFLGPIMPGTNTVRDVLRTYIEPPIDVTQYPSPLSGLRNFSSSTLRRYFDQDLLTVEGLQRDDLVRFAVLDSYDGLTWSANGSLGGAGFRRVGSQITTGVPGEAQEVTITIEDTYAGRPELNVWVPNVGPSAAISFAGGNSRTLEGSLAYDVVKGQPLVQSRLKSGDVITMDTIPVTVHEGWDTPLVPAGSTLVSPDTSQFIAARLKALAGGGEEGGPTPDAWTQLQGVGESFKNGKWSDGTRSGEERYRPGHGMARLALFINGDGTNLYTGSDEHYAATFALAANRLGFPARVVYGARIPGGSGEQTTQDEEEPTGGETPDDEGNPEPEENPDGAGITIKGNDVTAWVEINTPDGWVALNPALYTPDRDNVPVINPPVSEESTPPEIVPPPNPETPGSLGDTVDPNANIQTEETCELLGNCPKTTWEIIAMVGMYVGIGVGSIGVVLGLLLGWKALRMLRRRSSGSYAHRIASGWVEVLDRVRDTGKKVPASSTRKEQAAALGLEPVVDLVSQADRAMFQQNPPDQEVVDGLWTQIKETKKELLAPYGFFRKLWIRINPHSLAPMSKKGLGLAQKLVRGTSGHSAMKAPTLPLIGRRGIPA